MKKTVKLSLCFVAIAAALLLFAFTALAVPAAPGTHTDGNGACKSHVGELLTLSDISKTAAKRNSGPMRAPSLDPASFVYEDWVLDALKADRQAWQHFQSFPSTYRRIKVDRIQHYQHTGRPDYAQYTLQKFIRDCHAGRLQPGWSDFGRLEE